MPGLRPRGLYPKAIAPGRTISAQECRTQPHPTISMTLIPRQRRPHAMDSRLGAVVVEQGRREEGTEGVNIGEFGWGELGRDVDGDGDDGKNEDEKEGAEGHAVGEASEEGHFYGWKGFPEFAGGEGEEVHG